MLTNVTANTGVKRSQSTSVMPVSSASCAACAASSRSLAGMIRSMSSDVRWRIFCVSVLTLLLAWTTVAPILERTALHMGTGSINVAEPRRSIEMSVFFSAVASALSSRSVEEK